MKKRLFPAAGLVAAMFISLAHASSSVVHDSRGDSLSPAPYLDVVHAKVTEQRGKDTLLFMMQLAGPIPEKPSESFLVWVFHLDTDPAAPDNRYNEYIVRVRWSNGTFAGHVVDRTNATEACPTDCLTTTPVPFSIDGTTVKAVVPRELLGNPASFGWNAATRPSPPAAYLDIAPDGCDPSPVPCGLATWAR